MMTIDLQDRCELGQHQLMQQQYVEAEKTLADAEQAAWKRRDFDTLARLYMPLQEARRQRRQRCGEGVVCLDLLAESEADAMNARHVVENYPSGQLLVGGWASISPAADVRRCAVELDLYLETFLAAVYPTREGRRVVIVALDDEVLPAPTTAMSAAQLEAKLPPHCIVLRPEELPAGPRKGSAQTYAEVMALWERLHRPFIQAADAETDPLRRIEAYRTAIRVDYACELAHQHLSDLAHDLARRRQSGVRQTVARRSEPRA